jgi:hypothetical protein
MYRLLAHVLFMPKSAGNHGKVPVAPVMVAKPTPKIPASRRSYDKGEMTMKNTTITKTLTLAAVTALALGVMPTAKAANKGCSNASLVGTFAYTSTGFIVAAPIPSLVGPLAEVGTQTFDGKGGVSFAFNSSQNGNVGPGTATGSYTVNPDCTGTFTEATPMFTSHFSFVIDTAGAGFQAICQDPGVVVTRTGRLQFPVGDWRQ